MHISARVDYAMRALLVLTGASKTEQPKLVKSEALATSQQIPTKFLESILVSLRNAGIVSSHRGMDGGYRLAKSPTLISVADVMRALEGPLAAVRGERPEDMEYSNDAEHLGEVWIATRAALRNVLEDVSLEAVHSGQLPKTVQGLLSEPGAWERR
jgi:Rrf2 family protein